MLQSRYTRFLGLENCGGRVSISWVSHVVDSRTVGERESKGDEAKRELMKVEEKDDARPRYVSILDASLS